VVTEPFGQAIGCAAKVAPNADVLVSSVAPAKTSNLSRTVLPPLTGVPDAVQSTGEGKPRRLHAARA
jgi:hypothetical protein